jgi:hypothetical protein
VSILQTAVVFVGVPLAATLLLAACVYGRVGIRRDRYRPGRPWDFAPVWYVPHPAAFEPAPEAPQISQGATAATERFGGASGEW